MKRRLLIVTVFLLAGAVVNVAVAWGCAAWVRLGDPQSVHGSHPPGLFWNVHRFQNIGAVRVVSTVSRGGTGVVVSARQRGDLLAPSWGQINRPPLTDGPDFEMVIEDARGWPLLSLWCDWRQDLVSRADLSTRFEWQPTGSGGIELSSRPLGPPYGSGMKLWKVFRALPLRPIWPGFAVNTLLYATVLGLLICGPFVVRRWVRVQRGLCPKCAYPMGESAVCSECGRELPKRAGVVTT